MLSSAQTNGTGNLFNSKHHLMLIAQPVLSTRSRQKNRINSITNNRRSSYDLSLSIIPPINRIEQSQQETKNSSVSPVEVYSSTSSSVPRSLSVLNEDVKTNDGIRNLRSKRSIENTIDNHSHEQNQREKIHYNGIHFDKVKEPQSEKNELLRPATQQHRFPNDITNKLLPIALRKPNISPIRKKTKLDVIVEQSVPTSRLTTNKEQKYTISGTARSSRNKPKTITPLGFYSNQEQIRTNANRSVIERQHPIHLPRPSRKSALQQIIPLDNASLNVNNLLLRQQKLSTSIVHSSVSSSSVTTTQNLHQLPSRPIKRTLPVLHNEESIGHPQEQEVQKEKRRCNETNQHLNTSQTKQVQIEVEKSQDPLKLHGKSESHPLIISQKRQHEHEIVFKKNQKKCIENDQIDKSVTNTPRRYYQTNNDFNNNRQRPTVNHFYRTVTDNRLLYKSSNRTTQSRINTSYLNRSQQSIYSTHRFKPSEQINQKKNRAMNPNIELSRTSVTPFQSRRVKQISTPKIQNHPLKQNRKSPNNSMTNPLRTTPIQTNNTRLEREGNRRNNTPKINSTQKTSKGSSSQTISPTPCSILLDHLGNRQHYDSYRLSSSSHHELDNNTSNLTYRLLTTNEQQQQLHHKSYVIPIENSSQLPLRINPLSQTSVHHIHPSACTTPSTITNNGEIDNSSHDFNISNTVESNIDHRYILTPSHTGVSSKNRLPLALGKVTVLMEDEDDISTNYDSDDGWSNDSIEIIYIDERYFAEKKKIISSSFSHLHLQQNILLQ